MSELVIESFSGDYRFLSNFYPSAIRVDGVMFPTVEHAFQTAKTPDPQEKRTVAEVKSPGRAKQLGRKVRLRKDWEAVKVGIMKDLVLFKFREHADLAERLLDTEAAELVEGNTWNDCFWGVSNGRGENHLGKALMGVRELLHAEKESREG